MRLIDADNMDFTELADKLATIGMTGDLTDNGAEELLKEFMDAQPTAYDVEKVVEQLEEEINVVNNQIDRDSIWGLLGVREGYEEAIKIVKGGGENAE